MKEDRGGMLVGAWRLVRSSEMGSVVCKAMLLERRRNHRPLARREERTLATERKPGGRRICVWYVQRCVRSSGVQVPFESIAGRKVEGGVAELIIGPNQGQSTSIVRQEDLIHLLLNFTSGQRICLTQS